MAHNPVYILCADGACSGNPGPGGYAWELWSEEATEGNELTGGAGSSPQTTNNVMELMAARDGIEAVARSGQIPGQVKLRFDSEYVLKGIFEWMADWKARGWKTSGKKPVKNREIWEEIDRALVDAQSIGFSFEADWVRGHNGDFGNERVDLKAQEMRDTARGDARPEPVPTHSGGVDLLALAAAPQEPATIDAPSGLPSGEIHPAQVELMRKILDLYGAGDYSVKNVIEQIRANAAALGCR